MTTPEDPAPESSDPLDQLRERVRATQVAAEKLADEAAGMGGGSGEARGGRPPPRGWSVPGDAPRDPGSGGEFALVAALLDAAREAFPHELQQQLGELIRELLMLLRALIDWCLERLERRRRTPVEVEDIPIG